MNIAYLTDNFIGFPGNGIVSQANTWRNLLIAKGANVMNVSPWDEIDWKKIDIAHLFGSSGTWFLVVTRLLKSKGVKVVWSPICDNIDLPPIQYLKAHIGCKRLGMFSYPYIRKEAYRLVDAVCVRSNYEQDYIMRSYGVPDHKFFKVPLSLTYSDDYTFGDKENFCFHLSSIYQSRKNVPRLIAAARKYGFRLVLAGNMGNAEEYSVIGKAIGNADNIEVLGFISEEKKIELYKRAKVFALPSICEGVGIVALDAAHYGCEIVITSVGGPKEYYGGNAFVVNPYSVDEIGRAVCNAMQGRSQPRLKKEIDRLYSPARIAEILLEGYSGNHLMQWK